MRTLAKCLFAAFVLLIARAVVAQSCTGDCNGDGEVRINEVITCLDIGLQLLPLEPCPICDVDGDSRVSVSEIVRSISIGLGQLQPSGCVGGPARIDVTSERVVEASVPVALAFAPDGRLFFNELKLGRIRLHAGGKTSTFAEVEVLPCGEFGLIGLALDPAFEENHYVYVYYIEPVPSQERTGHPVIARFTDVDGVGRDATVIVGDLPMTADICNHVGGNIHFGPDGYLYVSIGDMQIWNPNHARDLGSPLGKVLRFDKRDGSAAPDNPFVDEHGAEPRVFAYGLRNTFNFTFHPVSGRMYAGENGRGNCDELNIIEAGNDYGHPEASIRGDTPPCMERVGVSPIYLYRRPGVRPEDDSSNVAPTGLTFVSGDVYPSLGDALLSCEFNTGFMRRLLLSGSDADHVTDDSIVVEDCALAATTDPSGIVYYSNWGEIRRLVPSSSPGR